MPFRRKRVEIAAERARQHDAAELLRSPEEEKQQEIAPTDAPLPPQGIAAFTGVYETARQLGATDAQETLDPRDVPLEKRAFLAELELHLGDELREMLAAADKVRLAIAERGMRTLEGTLYFLRHGVPTLAYTGLEMLDLHTKEKAYAALLEIIPTVALWYAITGKRLKFTEGKGVQEPTLEDIDMIDRALYLAGSVFFVGHVYTGLRRALVKKGVTKLLLRGEFLRAGKAVLPALSRLVGPSVARAQVYAKRKLTAPREEPKRELPEST